ncbi:MAG: nitrate/nitrite transporter NrtS [Alphaproteobacteria bacterium]
MPTRVDCADVGQISPSPMIGRLWRYAISDGVPRRSLAVALIVGTILNLINQGDALIIGEALNFPKLLLTYLVPYCVSTYGAVSYRLHAARAAPSNPAPILRR